MENTEAALQVITDEDIPENISSGHSSCSLMQAVEKIRDGAVGVCVLYLYIGLCI